MRLCASLFACVCVCVCLSVCRCGPHADEHVLSAANERHLHAQQSLNLNCCFWIKNTKKKEKNKDEGPTTKGKGKSAKSNANGSTS